jgi:hypothetical protein
MLACAARFSNIYISDAWFLTKEAHVSNYTVFGGSFVHIHYMKRDTAPFNAFLYAIEGPSENDKIYFDNLKNNEFLFIRGRDSIILELCDTFRIKNTRFDTEVVWIVRDGNLCFLKINGEVSNHFPINSLDQTVFKGNYINLPFPPDTANELKKFA